MNDKAAKAQRYAQAAFQALIERWQSSFVQVIEALGQDEEAFTLLADGSRSFDERERALEKVMPEDAPLEFVNLMKLLVQENDIDLLPELPGALSAVATGARQPVRAEVTSAVELTDAEKDALRRALSQRYGADLVFSFHVDPSLLGGLRVRVGDRLIDTSVASRMTALKESVASAVR